MRPSDRFRVGSVTKAFVATVVLQLAGERKLSLADSVERWLPGVVPDGSRITLRQLLNHTSGLFDYVEEPGFVERQRATPTKAWTPAQLVAIATAHDPLFAPGARWSYSNTGYILLGLVVEKATNHSLASELRKRIFAPLHLRATSFDTGTRMTGRYAHGYTRLRGPGLTDISVVSATVFGAAGAVVPNADDLARFFRALLDGDLLRPGLLARMKTTVKVTPQQRYGLGLFETRTPCGRFWGHGGGLFGYATFADSRADGARQLVLALTGDETVLRQRAQEALGRVQELAYCG
jgi:D-alanyl-D-alanine carboxypeptidase